MSTNIVATITKIIYTVLFVGLLSIAGLIVISTLNIPGNYKLYVVQSGSMEPTISTGSVIIVTPKENYQVGDIITAQNTNNSGTFTHRISAIEEVSGAPTYQTKGDANESPDPELTTSTNVLGSPVFWLPFIGYVVSFAKTQTGFILLVIVPMTIIIYSELMNVKNEAIRLVSERKKRKLSVGEKIEEKIGEELIAIEKKLK